MTNETRITEPSHTADIQRKMNFLVMELTVCRGEFEMASTRKAPGFLTELHAAYLRSVQWAETEDALKVNNASRLTEAIAQTQKTLAEAGIEV